jgi:hypothetical protein
MSSTDADYQGRVQSISMLSWSLFGLIALPIGILADHIGIQQTMVILGTVVMLGVSLLQLFARTDRVSNDRRFAMSNALEQRNEARAPAGGH